MSKKSEPERITLTFDLHDLPTAQHRAGLAGLILQIDSMGPDGNKRNPTLIPIIEELTPTTATITFTRDSMQGVFDDLYAAEIKEIVVANKWPGSTKPKPGEFFIDKWDPKTGEVRPVPGFGYDVIQPLAPCLKRHLQESAMPWLNLWRDMVWSIPRGGNNVLSRAPFNQRAHKPTDPCGEGSAAWMQIQDFQEKCAKSQFRTEAISGALLLGAQAVNAEVVPFSGRVDHNLLLHFWQVVVLTFVPQELNKKDAKIQPKGYVLTIPDVSDLCGFRRAFPEFLGSLTARPNTHTPAEARIDLPAQANLEVLRKLKGGDNSGPLAKRAHRAIRRGAGAAGGHVQAISAGKATREDWSGSVRAIESYHMLKLGNNVKMLSFARVSDRPGLVDDYERIDSTFRNPLFRASLMQALIQEEPWHTRMIELFAEYPWPFFIEGDDTPKYLPRFGRDAKDQFLAFYQDIHDMKPNDMNEKDRLKHLSVIVQRLVKKYVDGRAEAKTGKKIKDFPKRPTKDREVRIYPEDFREAQQRVCSDAFLAMRSRHDEDFVEFFAGSICSVAQFLPVEDFQFLIQTLMTKPDPNPVSRKGLSWEDVKAVAMIAVSACSFQVRPRDIEPQGSPS